MRLCIECTGRLPGISTEARTTAQHIGMRIGYLIYLLLLGAAVLAVFEARAHLHAFPAQVDVVTAPS